MKIILVLICIKIIFLPLNCIAQINVEYPDYVTYSNQEFINNSQVYGVKESPQGLIYIASNLGIHEYDGENWRELNTGDYGGRINIFDIDKDTGIIYFGKSGELAYLQPTKNGQWEYDSINHKEDKDCILLVPDSNKINGSIRKLNNDSLILYGTNLTKQKQIDHIYKEITNNKAIAYKLNETSFEFGSPYFEKEWLNQYTYILEEYDTSEVKARDISNTENDHFAIIPPYYRGLLALLICAFILISTCCFAIWHLKKKSKFEKEKLQIIINQSRSKILSQEKEIENQNKLLKKANQKLHQLLLVASKVSNPVIICNPLGIIEWGNNSSSTYFGKTLGEMINGHYNLLDASFNPDIKTHFNTCVNEKKAVIYTINANKLTTNRSVWMQTTLNPIVNDFGKLINVVAISSEITDLHELNNTRDIILSAITHDLKSPLLAFKLITGNSLKQLQELKYEKLKENLNELHEHSTKMYEFFKYLANWLKSQRGPFVFVPHIFDFSMILKDVLNLFYMSINEKKLRIENKIPDFTEVFADKNMIKTVLRNLISNAIKFSKRGDIVTLSLKKDKKKIVVAVSDNGIGISKDQRGKMFSTNENKGLGLIICNEFIQKNNGKIWIEDKEQGTLVKFTIPNCKLEESYA